MASGLIEIMKRAAMDANENSKPCDLRYGTVTAVSPLKIQITNQFILPESILIVPEHLTDYEREVTIDWATENYTHTHTIGTPHGAGSCSSDTHTHAVKGKKKMTVHGALKVGDKVAILRQSGGQFYYVLDRLPKE